MISGLARTCSLVHLVEKCCPTYLTGLACSQAVTRFVDASRVHMSNTVLYTNIAGTSLEERPVQYRLLNQERRPAARAVTV